MEMGKMEKSLKLETYITRRKLNPNQEETEKKNRKDSVRRISLILKKCESLRTPEENRLLESFSDVARQINKRKERLQIYKDRVIEKEDATEIITRKAEKLAEIISRAKHLVCYTGAGISTSARIPDYRGSQGIWTLLQQGKDIGQHDLSLADPTYTHMALYELHRRKMLRFVVSQNCDGLHLRAGLPKSSLSEVHGNMYIEACKNCKPNVEYWRLFDTTEFTARFYHKTHRRCHFCGKPLTDTIVHFGERGSLKWPLNWAGACSNAEKADVILCLGSSLKVLRKYSWLWQMDKTQKKRAKICIINLQWTPKDKLASIKINGKCDEIMRLVMKNLNINVPDYDRQHDPIFAHATLLCSEELHTVSQPMLKIKKEIKSEDEGSGEQSTPLDSEQNSSLSVDQEIRLSPSKEERRMILKGRKPLILSPIKSMPFVKTNLNSRHLIQMEDSSTSSLESDSETEEEEEDDDDDDDDDDIASASQEENLNFSDKTDTSQEIKEKQLEEHFERDKNSSSVETDNCVQRLAHLGIIDNKRFSSEDETAIRREEHTKENVCTNSEGKEGKVELKKEPADALKMSNPEIPQFNAIGKQQTESNENNLQEIVNRIKRQQRANDCDNRKHLLGDEYSRQIGKTSVPPPALGISNITTIARLSKPNCDSFANSICNSSYLRQKLEEEMQNLKLPTPEHCYKIIFEYYKAIEHKLPYWYDVRYAYSGLHSIILPPPPEINLWSSQVVPIFKMNRQEAECEFCFDNYAEFTCQFYKKLPPDFLVKKFRRGQVIVCECCDYTDNEDDNDPDLTAKKYEKRAKLDIPAFKDKEPIKVQAGWYGKGYRKNFRKKRK